ncbi:MAG: acyl carrier protein [Pseudomonadota bacterium]
MNKTEQQLIELFVESGIPGASDADADYCLFDDKSLDSFGRISIFMELESEFQVRLDPQELMLTENRSVRGLARLIETKSSGSVSAAG